MRVHSLKDQRPVQTTEVAADIGRAGVDRNGTDSRLDHGIARRDRHRRKRSHPVPCPNLADLVDEKVSRRRHRSATANALAIVDRFNRGRGKFPIRVTAAIFHRLDGHLGLTTTIAPTQLAAQRAADQYQDQEQVEESSHGEFGKTGRKPFLRSASLRNRRNDLLPSLLLPAHLFK